MANNDGTSAKNGNGGDLLGGLRMSLIPSAADAPAAPPDLRKRALSLALALVVETIVLGGAFGFLLWMSSGRMTERTTIEQGIQEAERQTAAKVADVRKAATYNAQTVAVKEALDGHVRWTNFFAYLEERTKPTVKYASFTGDADSGVITLDAIGASYRDVAEQIVIFREDPLVAEVRATSATASMDERGELRGITFTLGLKVKNELWRGVYSSTLTPAQAAVTSVECGASAQSSDAAGRCFAAKVASCGPATVTARNTLGNGEWLVIGPAADGCRVAFTYAADLSLTEFAGKSYECVYDPAREFWGQTDRALDGCTGTLIDALAPSSTVTP